MDDQAEAPISLLAWYDRLQSRRVDLVGDYAGRERFLIEGDSLLLQCFSDSKIDFKEGFQVLHATYAVESFLGRLVRRNCNFHVAFFDHHSRLCIPPGTSGRDASKYLLARSAIIRHLSEHLPDVQPHIEIHNFSSIQDDEFAEYLKNAGIYFIMCHDGTKFARKGQYLAANPSNSETVIKYKRRFQMADFKVLIWWSIRAGYNVALINGIEWRDTKVFTFVVEGSLNQRTAVMALDQDFAELLKLHANEGSAGVGSANAEDRTVGENELGTLQTLKKAKEHLATERTLVSLLALARILQDDEEKAESAYAFLLHMALLNHLPLASRRLAQVKRESDEDDDLEEDSEEDEDADSEEDEDDDDTRAFMTAFTKEASLFIGDSSWADTLTELSIPCDVADLVDGRLYNSASYAVEKGLDVARISSALAEELQLLVRALEELCGVEVEPADHSDDDDMQLQALNIKDETTDENVDTLTILPFSNPVFNRHLDPIKISAKVVDRRLQNDQSSRIFKELSHWHNSKRLLDTKNAPRPVKVVDKWGRSRALRRDQLFMSEMKAYAASLTNAAGKVLEPSVITTGGSKPTNAKEPPPGKPPAKQPVKGGKQPAQTNKATPRQSIASARAVEENKDRDKLLSAWKKKQEIIYVESDPQRTYKGAEGYLNDLPDAKRAIVEADVRLFMLQTLLKLWSRYGKEGKPEAMQETAALAWETLRQLATETRGLTKTIVSHMKKVSTILGLPVMLPEPPAEDRPITFKFEMPSNTEAITVSKTPLNFVLSHCGPYLDRSVDSAKDARVAFQPDAWQRRVLDELDADRSVFIVAPTSAGKTFISFYAMEKVLRKDDDGILVYVAPTKALVNQIAAEIEARFTKKFKYPGKSVWAIHTRDYRIHNPKTCQILVTVPHILQIMLLAPGNANSWSSRVKRIIFDEIHSIGQADDGVVWEQLLLLSPCPIIALSATVGNPEAFSSWLGSSQQTLGKELTMIKHDQRYSDLRKFLYVPPKEFVFKGLPLNAAFAKLGLDGTPSFAFVHPVASLVNKSRGMPDDLTLEARDCLLLWQAMKKCETKGYPIGSDLDPAKALPAVPKRVDIVAWEKKLKGILQKWMADNDSPFDQVLEELSKSIHQTARPSVQVSSAGHSKDGAEAQSQTIDPNDLCATTLPLLCKLQEQGALPAILFNYDRLGCEKICSAVLQQLKTAEEQWKESSSTWKSRVATFEKWKAIREKQKSAKTSAASKKSTKGKEEGEGGLSKAERERDTASEDSSFWETFDPEAPLEEFSFANKKKSDLAQLKEMRRRLERRGVAPDLIDALSRGLGVHHSGMNRAYRHVVEILFRRGFLRVVIATGTLALGINMPCTTVVFAGDSVFLTALNFRQAAGRAGRRGFDLLGNVVFQGISKDKMCRLLSSRLPDLNGHFPLTTTLVLRLFTLLHESKNSKYAQDAINSLLSQPRLYLGGASFKEQVLHHLRFSIEYLRRQQLLGADGAPLNFAGCVSHLYYTENSSFAFHTLLKNGYFHDLCANLGSNGTNVVKQLMIVMAHLFGRRPCREPSPDFIEKVVKRSPSVVFLPPMPEKAAQIMRSHNQDTLNVFSTYVRTFIDQHLKEDDCKLPLTGYEVKPHADEEVEVPYFRTLPPTTCRSAFVALSGHSDAFESISDMCNTVRDGVFLEEAVVPHLDIYPDESSTPLNAYLYDFYMHGDITALERANGIRKSEVWFDLNDFSMVLATIITSLENFLGLKPDADLDMLEVAGDGDNVEMTNEEESIASTEITVPSIASMPQQDQQQQQQQSLRKPPTKKKVVKESWDDDATDEESKGSASDDDDDGVDVVNGSLGGQGGKGGKGNKSWLDPDGGGGLLDVLAAFQRLRTEFDEKFRAMWA